MGKSIISLRPQDGERNTVEINGFRFCLIISHKFICPKCRIFCGEMVPILDGGTRARLRKMPGGMLANTPQAKVYCYNGCHDHPSWGWEIFRWDRTADVDSIAEWPEEWKDNEIEKKVRDGGAGLQ